MFLIIILYFIVAIQFVYVIRKISDIKMPATSKEPEPAVSARDMFSILYGDK